MESISIATGGLFIDQLGAPAFGGDTRLFIRYNESKDQNRGATVERGFSLECMALRQFSVMNLY